MGFGEAHLPSLEAARQLASELERRRTAKGLVRDVLALRMDIPGGVLEAWENGRAFPSAPALINWMQHLGCSISLGDHSGETQP